MECPSVRDSAHVLIVDDDQELRDLLSRFLKKHGYRVDVARDGREMWRALESWRIDLIVLDLMLPGEDGLNLCRSLRVKMRTPVIMLTAKGEETDRIVGLEMGADDYIAKPFSPRELLARTRAVLRRSGHSSVDEGSKAWKRAAFEGWSVDIARRSLRAPDGMTVDLTDGEFDLLVAFVEHPQKILSREQLLDFARGRAPSLYDRSVDVQVGRLRRKIETDADHPRLIRTVRGQGYLFATEVGYE